MKHERQVLLAGWDQSDLSRARVAIVGCGALGSNLGLALGHLGVGSITLLDADVLEEHNLENQAFDEFDLGKPKAVALRDRIRSLDPVLQVKAVIARFQDYRHPIDADYVFGCVDNVATRHHLNYWAVANRRVLLDAGIEGFRGVVRTIIPGKTACQSCYPFLPKNGPKASCSTNPIPTTGLTAAITANLQALQFLKLIQSRPCPSYLAVDLSRGLMGFDDFVPNPACELCSHLAPSRNGSGGA